MTTTIPQPFSIDTSRPLRGMEHLLSLLEQHWPVHFSLAAQIEGYASVPVWRAALDELQQRHPLLSVAIDTNSGLVPHFRTVRNAPIPLRIIQGSAAPNWQTEIARELVMPFDAQQAPPARAVLMHGQRESVFILTTHHSIADGLSSAYAIRDVLHALTGKTLEHLPPVPALEQLVYMSRNATINADDVGQFEPPPEGRALKFRAIDDSLPRIEALSLTPEMTQTLIERARIERTTVHGALCSALVLAGRESFSEWEDSTVRVRSPFSLRKQLGIGEDFGLFTWSASVPINPRTTADFWHSARSAKALLAEKQLLGRIVQEMKGLETAVNSGIGMQGAAQISEKGYACELMLTNLGRPAVQFDSEGFRLKALWGPAVLMGFDNEQTVGVTTANDSLCLLHTSFTPIPSLLPRAAEILEQACE
jgi:hypothetical protein